MAHEGLNPDVILPSAQPCVDEKYKKFFKMIQYVIKTEILE